MNNIVQVEVAKKGRLLFTSSDRPLQTLTGRAPHQLTLRMYCIDRHRVPESNVLCISHSLNLKWCPIAGPKTLSQTQMVSNTQCPNLGSPGQVKVPETTSSFSQVVKALVKPSGHQ